MWLKKRPIASSFYVFKHILSGLKSQFSKQKPEEYFVFQIYCGKTYENEGISERAYFHIAQQDYSIQKSQVFSFEASFT